MPRFLVTIDVEGDNIWAHPPSVNTENAAYLAPFQALCERYGMRPTYLVNYEMATSAVFREFGTDVLHRNVAEIGMHLHAWNTPPAFDLTGNDIRHQPYLTDHPRSVVVEKVLAMTRVLEGAFDTKMVSHRAGRWSIDGVYAQALIACGYLVDCSVTPHVNWHHVPGDPKGRGGANYTDAPESPYFVDPVDPRRSSGSLLLEVPMTIVPVATSVGRAIHFMARRAGRRIDRLVKWASPTVAWLRPNGRNLAAMLDILKVKHAEKAAHVEFMLHSSELMPGGSPTFQTPRSIEKLYEDLEALFAAAEGFTGATLAEFRRAYGDAEKTS